MVYGANDNKSKYRTNWFYLLEVLKKANGVIIANFNSGQAMKVIGPLSRSLKTYSPSTAGWIVLKTRPMI